MLIVQLASRDLVDLLFVSIYYIMWIVHWLITFIFGHTMSTLLIL